MPFRRRQFPCTSSLSNYIAQNSEAQHSSLILLFMADCRVMSKKDRLTASYSRLWRIPTDWKPEANDVIIPCVTISNPLGSSLILNISEINGPNRCRKKHSKSFMLQRPFSLRIYGSSSSILSQERKLQPSVMTSSPAQPSSSQSSSVLQVYQAIFRRTEDWFSWTPLDLLILTSMMLIS